MKEEDLYDDIEDVPSSISEDVENLGPSGQNGYDFAMETMLSAADCPQCVAAEARRLIEKQLCERKSVQKNRGKLIACKQILLIPHRCGKGVKGYGYKASEGRDYESEASFR